MVERLFVYGSLRPQGQNAHILEGIRGDWERGWVWGRLSQGGWGSALGYPALTLDAHAEVVEGEVLTSSTLHEHWERLDEFEGSEYQRVRATVSVEDGSQVEAFVYVLRL